jgi:hypothetical protein
MIASSTAATTRVVDDPRLGESRVSSFHRVVALSVQLAREDLARLEKGVVSAETVWFGRTVRVSASFEAKPGGGGHVVIRPASGRDVRFVVEADSKAVRVVACVIGPDFRHEDDEYRKSVERWLRDVFKASPLIDEGRSEGTL